MARKGKINAVLSRADLKMKQLQFQITMVIQRTKRSN